MASKATTASPPVKLGDQIARRLEDAIAEKSMASGTFLGNEISLSQSYGVSRSTIREAIAIGEWEGFLENRRGREGGLYVAAAKSDDAILALRNYLFLAGAELGSLLDARAVIDGLMLDLVMERIQPEHIAQFQAILAEKDDDIRHQLNQLLGFVSTMTAAVDFPLLGIISAALRHCFVDRAGVSKLKSGTYLRASAQVTALRRRLIEAIISNDVQAARRLHVQAIDHWRSFADDAEAERIVDKNMLDRLCGQGPDAVIYEFVEPVKKSEAAARLIAQKILNEKLQAGDKIGVEPEIIADLKISRRVFREALRILERFGIAQSGRGKSGGISVGQPQHAALLRVTDRSIAASGDIRMDDYRQLAQIIFAEGARRSDKMNIAAIGVQSGDAALKKLASMLALNCNDVVIKTLLLVVASACPSRATIAPGLPQESGAESGIILPRKISEFVGRCLAD